MAVTSRGAQQSVQRPATADRENRSHLAPDRPVPLSDTPPTSEPVIAQEASLPKVIRMDENRTVLRGRGTITFRQGQVVQDPWLICAAVDNYVGFQVIKA
jgi:hypothetical protein